MSPERWQQIKAVLADALERSSAERAAFLEEACGSDPSLRAEVESLIAYEQVGDGVIDPPSFERRGQASILSALLAGQFETTDLISEQPSAETGWRIGPYKIVRELGRGGMGAVYLAARADDQ